MARSKCLKSKARFAFLVLWSFLLFAVFFVSFSSFSFSIAQFVDTKSVSSGNIFFLVWALGDMGDK